MTDGGYSNFLIRRTHHLFVNIVLACETSDFRARPRENPRRSPKSRAMKGLGFAISHSLSPPSRSRVWKTSVRSETRDGSLPVIQPASSAFRAGDFGDFSVMLQEEETGGARFRDAGTKVPACRLARRRAPRAARRPGTSRARRDRTPKGVTALSVARATDDRPVEGECP